ncbi:hypothetical protein SAY87_018255 [Trapa incisa]|uniref:SWI/SNF-related matrix-associated actin-dependent regulator of chromatin subfamily A member 3-like 1 n=1 Tax=Trapa incisa TaxID=236973 RepID=A0AAN7QWU6_9MYRT|nr:hypothetical protein SAY87_018255 [Trapa incisa]
MPLPMMDDANQYMESDYVLARHLQLQELNVGGFPLGSQDDPNEHFLDDDSQPSQFASSSSEPYMLGFVLANIVGIQYYLGTISGRELVGLVREPLNPYDSNAIKVLNTRNIQVGHIERITAAILAPLIDSNMIIIEGIVPSSRSAGNRFKIPCQIHIFARDDMVETVKEAISQKGLVLIPETSVSFTLSEAAVVMDRKKKKGKVEKRSLDEIFDLMDKNINEKAKMETLSLEPPKEVIKPELMEHQKVGLGWMVLRESSEELPPFWEEKAGEYVNVLTNFVTQQRPEPLRGGIFADDMGLGKTLTLLSLIALDKFGSPSVSSIMNDEQFGGEGEKFEDSPPVPSSRKRRRAQKGPASRSTKESKAKKICSLTSKTSHLNHKMTLVVCPPSVFATWIAQLEEHTISGKLKIYMYYGTERTRSVQELSKYDIVLTTYSTLASEQASQDETPVRSTEWWRIILDEAHMIKNPKALQSLAVANLMAKRRWVVTGTPIQNGSYELFSLMAFLHFEPFSIKSYWQSLIQRPLNQGKGAGLSRLQILMATISLRRTKDKALAGLPKKTVETCLIDLYPEERRLYNRMETEARNIVRNCIREGTLTRNYTTILSVLLRLRQICICLALCPPDLKSILPAETMEDISKNPELLKKVVEVLQDGEDLDCPICISSLTDVVITSCAHVFCRRCILKVINGSNSRCPLCRRPISESDLFSAPPESLKNEDQETLPSKTISTSAAQSSKVSCLMKLLKVSRDQNPTTKSVIYSQFRKMLILLEEPLKEAGFKALRLDGSMNARKRAEVIEEFGSCKSDGPVVLLASIRSSGAGINLTAASVVYLLEPWWNPAVEEQAMDRVHRIGQDKEVRIIRMIVRDSIEEKVLELQEKKKGLARDAFLGKDGGKGRREVGEQDIRSLVSL